MQLNRAWWALELLNSCLTNEQLKIVSVTPRRTRIRRVADDLSTTLPFVHSGRQRERQRSWCFWFHLKWVLLKLKVHVCRPCLASLINNYKVCMAVHRWAGLITKCQFIWEPVCADLHAIIECHQEWLPLSRPLMTTQSHRTVIKVVDRTTCAIGWPPSRSSDWFSEYFIVKWFTAFVHPGSVAQRGQLTVRHVLQLDQWLGQSSPHYATTATRAWCIDIS